MTRTQHCAILTCGLLNSDSVLMDQFAALIWLKWTLFRNAMRSRKAVLGRVASVLGTGVALVVALLVALALGFAVYNVLSPDSLSHAMSRLPPEHHLLVEF